MSTLSAVITDLFENASENDFWKFVSKAQWTKDHDSDRIKKMILQTMDKESASELNNTYRKLNDTLHRHISNDVEGVGDDSYSDLIAHIVGTGKTLYDAVMRDPSIAQRMVDDRAFKESFSYSFPYPEDWNLNDPKFFMKKATKYLEDLAPLTTGKIQMSIRKEDVNLIRKMVKRLRSVESGNFRKAVDGWGSDEYSRWGALTSRAQHEALDLHYGFGNLLNDVQQFAV